jgi:hypothetical protein
METFKLAFSGKDKPIRLLYTKGEDLVVERSSLASEEADDPFVTPYQMIRQHAELEILESANTPLLTASLAVQEVRRQGFELTAIVCRTVKEIQAWLPDELNSSHVFGAEVFVDPDCPEEHVFFCGSGLSSMIRDIEKSILCRMV